jgi:hypothetical protein
VGSGEVPHQGGDTAAVQQTQYTGTFVHHHTLPPGVAYGGGQPHGTAAVAGRGALPYTMLVMGPDIVEEEVFENERFQPFRWVLVFAGAGAWSAACVCCHTHTMSRTPYI